ncbi:MAG: dipeptide/oligopeptide/nickel ABC transporter ATP-binding protein [Treponema sp.]|nr:dipeptide/oligopeptide/nickel ABC transporter ATP-binding protein [Treponema sp.]
MLRARDIHKQYGHDVHAVRGLSIEIERGAAVALAGESGCGKSTLARLLCCLEWCDGGTVELDGCIYNSFRGGYSLNKFRRKVQIIFQDSAGSMDSRMTLRQTIAEPLDNFDPLFRRASRKEKDRRIAELLDQVGLNMDKARCYPHELSGGQRQRALIARALAPHPEYLICDEPVSSLDAESRDRITELLFSLQRQTGLGCLFISHDPILSSRISSRIHIMEQGKIVETKYPKQGEI